MSVTQLVLANAAVAFTSCLPHSWQQYSLILMKGGLFADLCNATDVPASHVGALCQAQEKRVGDLVSVFFGCWSAGGILAGPSIDYLGPRWTALIGELVILTATLAIAVAGTNGTVVIVSLAVQGLFCNFVLYTAMVLADFHPTRAVFVTAIATASQYFGAVIPPVMLSLWSHNPHWQFTWIWVTYIVAIMIPIAIPYIWLMPTERSLGPGVSQPHVAAAKSLLSLNSMASIVPQSPATPMRALYTPSNVHTVRTISKQSLGGQSFHMLSVPALQPLPEIRIPEESVCDTTLVTETLPISTPPAHMGILRAMCGREYLLILILSSLPALMHVYYPAVVRDLSGIRVSEIFGWAMMSQGVTCIFFGWLGDRVLSSTMMALMNLLTMIVYILALIPNENLQIFTVLVFVVANSYIYNPRYTACRVLCDPRYLGTMMGTAGVALGLAELCNIPIARQTAYTEWCWIFVAVSMLQWPLIYFLYRFEARHLHTHRCPTFFLEDPGPMGTHSYMIGTLTPT